MIALKNFYSCHWQRLKKLLRLLVSLMNFRQRVVKVYFPPPLDVSRQTQQPQNSAEQHVISRASSSWWFIASRNQESTRSTKTMMNTTITNTVPGNLQGEHNNIILLAIYNVYNAIYRSTECTQFTPLFFTLLFFKTRLIYLPWKSAK
jgi:hypothetical protein